MTWKLESKMTQLPHEGYGRILRLVFVNEDEQLDVLVVRHWDSLRIMTEKKGGHRAPKTVVAATRWRHISFIPLEVLHHVTDAIEEMKGWTLPEPKLAHVSDS